VTPRGPVLAIAHQIGAARAVGPVIEALRRRGENVIAIASDLAVTAFEEQCIQFFAMNVRPESAAQLAAEQLDQSRPAVVLSGTSAGVTLEKAVVAAANRGGIPTIGILDHWSNYSSRFEGPSGIRHYFPALLAVMDETARRDLLALHYPADAIAVTGHPAFDALISFAKEDRVAMRRRLGVSHGEKLVIFASEPQRRDHGSSLGYDEMDALKILLDVLSDMPKPRPRLIIKPHPTESPTDLQLLARAYCGVWSVVTDVHPRTLMLAADVVVGMTSLFLVEAALLGTPAVSVQPNLVGEDRFIGNRLGVTHAAGSRESCRSRLLELFSNHDRERTAATARRALGVDGGAAERVAKLLSTRMQPDYSHSNSPIWSV